MAKGQKSTIKFEVRCDRHGTSKTNKDATFRSVWGNPPHHDRGLKQSGCPVCRAEKRKESKN